MLSLFCGNTEKHSSATASAFEVGEPLELTEGLPDLALWCATLARLGVTTSSQLASYLLDTWAIATLPGVAFSEEPEALRLRLATSMLCSGPANLSPQEQTASLWQLLARADSLPVPGATDQSSEPDLPELARAQQRWREVIAHLNSLA